MKGAINWAPWPAPPARELHTLLRFESQAVPYRAGFVREFRDSGTLGLSLRRLAAFCDRLRSEPAQNSESRHRFARALVPVLHLLMMVYASVFIAIILLLLLLYCYFSRVVY